MACAPESALLKMSLPVSHADHAPSDKTIHLPASRPPLLIQRIKSSQLALPSAKLPSPPAASPTPCLYLSSLSFLPLTAKKRMIIFFCLLPKYSISHKSLDEFLLKLSYWMCVYNRLLFCQINSRWQPQLRLTSNSTNNVS